MRRGHDRSHGLPRSRCRDHRARRAADLPSARGAVPGGRLRRMRLDCGGRRRDRLLHDVPARRGARARRVRPRVGAGLVRRPRPDDVHPPARAQGLLPPGGARGSPRRPAPRRRIGPEASGRRRAQADRRHAACDGAPAHLTGAQPRPPAALDLGAARAPLRLLAREVGLRHPQPGHGGRARALGRDRGLLALRQRAARGRRADRGRLRGGRSVAHPLGHKQRHP